MAEYQKTIITNAGISILNRVLASKATVTFTRAVSSTDDLSNKTESELRAMTSFGSIMQNGVCSRYNVHNQNMVSLDLVFTNENLGNSYMINTVGLYAKASDSSTEVLYAIARAGKDTKGNNLAEQMPAYSGGLTKFTISLYTQVGQASSVSVSIIDEGVVKSVNGTIKPDANGNVVLPFQSQAEANQLRADLTNNINNTAATLNATIAKNKADADSKLETEANTRAQNDNAFNNRLNALSDALTSETANRKNNDDANLAAAKSYTDTKIQAETAARTNADTVLSNRIATVENNKADKSNVYDKGTADSRYLQRDASTTLKSGSILSWDDSGHANDVNNLPYRAGGLHWSGKTDSAEIRAEETWQDNLDLVFDLGDDGSNIVDFRWNNVSKAKINSQGKFTGHVDWANVDGKDTYSRAEIDSQFVHTSGDTMSGNLVLDASHHLEHLGGVVNFSKEFGDHTSINSLFNAVRNLTGCSGSFSLTAKDGVLNTGWYNFIWIPHRNGGIGGIDNNNFGTMLLVPFGGGSAWIVNYNNAVVNRKALAWDDNLASTTATANAAKAKAEANANSIQALSANLNAPGYTATTRTIGVNLNSFTELGSYYFPSSANCVNCPINENQKADMCVENRQVGGTIIQKCYFMETYNTVYIRTTSTNGSIWNTWAQISGLYVHL